MIRFLHTGDWQLGMTRHFLNADAQARFSEARFDAITRMAALARDENCGFTVVCGDVFESNQVERRTVARALEALAEFETPVFLLPGNHDPLDAGSVFRSAAFREHCPPGVRVLESSDPIEVSPGVEIVGAPWSSKRPLEDLLARACAPLAKTAGIRVAVAHGGIDVLSPQRDAPDRIELEAAERALADGRIHFVALGDRHSLTRVGDGERIWYAGAPEPTDYVEQQPGHALVVELDRDAIRVRPHRIGSWQFLRERDFEVNGAADLDRLERWLGDIRDKGRTIVKLSCVGSLGLRERARFDDLIERSRDLFAAIELDDTLQIVAHDADFADLDVSGFARDALEELRSSSLAPGADGETARDALALMLRMAAGSP